MKDLAKEIGVARGTLYKWIAGAGVTVENVRRVAAVAGDPAEVVLRAAAGKLLAEDDDVQIREILDSSLSEADKQELVAYVVEQREAAATALRKQIEMMIRGRRAG